MASQEITEKGTPISTLPVSKSTPEWTTSNVVPNPGTDQIHFVPRKEELPDYDDAQKLEITGYDADLMRARATLSNVEEKKLLRRVDWHLIPLLAVMYMVKSIDFTNVRVICRVNGNVLDLTTAYSHQCRSQMP